MKDQLINFVRVHNILNLSLDNIELAKDLCENPNITKEHKYECSIYLQNSLQLLSKGVHLLN